MQLAPGKLQTEARTSSASARAARSMEVEVRISFVEGRKQENALVHAEHRECCYLCMESIDRTFARAYVLDKV